MILANFIEPARLFAASISLCVWVLTFISNPYIDDATVRAIDELKAELSAVSKLTRNLQAEILKIDKAQSEGAKDSRSSVPAPGELSQTATSNTMTWVEFHRLVRLEPPSNKEKTKPNAELALAKAIEMGVTGWRFDSTNKNFRHSTPKPSEQL